MVTQAMPLPPVDHPLNLTTQGVLLYGSWVLTAVLLVFAVQLGRRERTPFYVLLVLAAMVGAFVEPLYDTAMMLYFYSTEGMATHFTAFDIPQPLWTHSGYAVLYASAAILITRSAWQGTLTRQRLGVFAGTELLMSCVFEMIGINGGAYAYWGPHTLRIFQYPLVIGVLETAQVVAFAIAAALLRQRMSGRPVTLLWLFVIFPCTFLGGNFGAGWPVIIAIHLAEPNTAITAGATVLSIVLAGLLVRGAAGFLPVLQRRPAVATTAETAPVAT
ncbi:hypothetical protein [Pseudonocardia spinosispora]|uniref:hypothetical protein n=1 Tax=Pseudonocardia spinosispora TaxID=103441 RepID=UPI0003FC4C4F|nr:hypothetical protein [Pseudonocardia spinosispora]